MARNSNQFGPIRRALGNLGDAAGCHQLPERTIHLYGAPLPLCARCTGILLGHFLGISTAVCGYNPGALLSVACVCVMVLDGALQYRGVFESTNARRLITGGLCGAGVVWLIVRAWGIAAAALAK